MSISSELACFRTNLKIAFPISQRERSHKSIEKIKDVSKEETSFLKMQLMIYDLLHIFTLLTHASMEAT